MALPSTRQKPECFFQLRNKIYNSEIKLSNQEIKLSVYLISEKSKIMEKNVTELDKLRDIIVGAKSIVFFGGAGVSTPAVFSISEAMGYAVFGEK
jgi:uncharacterized protein with ACT and thioredoxin-like domain